MIKTNFPKSVHCFVYLQLHIKFQHKPKSLYIHIHTQIYIYIHTYTCTYVYTYIFVYIVYEIYFCESSLLGIYNNYWLFTTVTQALINIIITHSNKIYMFLRPREAIIKNRPPTFPEIACALKHVHLFSHQTNIVWQEASFDWVLEEAGINGQDDVDFQHGGVLHILWEHPVAGLVEYGQLQCFLLLHLQW